MTKLETLRQALMRLDKKKFKDTVSEVVSSTDPDSIISNFFVPLLNETRAWYRNNKIAIPELLLSIQLLMDFLEIATRQGDSGSIGNGKTIVLGVIEGDPHDLGKNIIRRVYECYGFKVYDLGKGVSPENFVTRARDLNADIVGISTMMSTTVPSVRKAVELLRNRNRKVKVMVGGAFITSEVAKRLGADGWAESAGDLIEQTERALERGGH